jgi:hypothetical protein
MRKRRSVVLSSIGLALALGWLVPGAGVAAVGYSLRLRADPQRVPADGKSQVVVTVEVADSRGLPPAQGTIVNLVTSAGQIVSPVQAVGGLAQSVLTAPSRPGIALVSAIVGASRATLQVEFLPVPGSAPAGDRLVTLAADEVSYSAEKRVFVASTGGGGSSGGPGSHSRPQGRCELRYQGLICSADGMQYEMERGVVRAQGNVVLRSGEKELRADALRYDLVSLQGRLVRVSGEVERLVVEGAKLETRPDTKQDDPLWEAINTDDTRTWVKAKRAIVDPGRKIILDHATFYVDDAPVMSVRRHVLDPGAGGAVFGNALGYTTGSGINVDMPWYYRAGEHHVGSLHLTRNRSANGSRYDGGWAMGLREEYLREGRMDGSFQVDDIANPRRGARWQHSHSLGGGSRLELDASAFSFGDDTPDLLGEGLTYWRPVSRGSLMLALSRTEYGESLQDCGELAYHLPTVKAGRAALVTPALHLRASRAESPEEALLIDPATGEPVLLQQTAQRAASLGADVNIESVGKDLGRGLRLGWGMTTGYAKLLSGGWQSLLDARVSLDRGFGAGSQAGLTYSFSANPNGFGPSIFSSGPRQMLGLRTNLVVQGSPVQATVSQELGGSRRYGSLSVSRPLSGDRDLLGRSLWSLDLSRLFTRADGYRVGYTRMALNRLVGRYRASLVYSPEGAGQFDSRPWVSAYGYGYTYSGGRHLWLEFSAAPQ